MNHLGVNMLDVEERPLPSPPAAGAAFDVSVIVIGSDVRDEVLACLASIEEHAGSASVEAIVVDNGSSDGTARAVAERFPSARVVARPRNEGDAGRNHGLAVATGRLRMFLDSDAALKPGALDTLVGFLDEHGDVGVVAPRMVYPDARLQLSARRFPPLFLPLMRRPPLRRLFENSPSVRRHLMADDPHDRIREVEYVLGACLLFTAEAQRAAGPVDPRTFYGPFDADWCLRVRAAGLRVIYHAGAEVVHGYRRSTARRPLSRRALRQLASYCRFQWHWRHDRARLVAEGRVMDERAAAELPVATTPEAGR